MLQKLYNVNNGHGTFVRPNKQKFSKSKKGFTWEMSAGSCSGLGVAVPAKTVGFTSDTKKAGEPYQNTFSCSYYDLASIWLEGYIINTEINNKIVYRGVLADEPCNSSANSKKLHRREPL